MSAPEMPTALKEVLLEAGRDRTLLANRIRSVLYIDGKRYDTYLPQLEGSRGPGWVLTAMVEEKIPQSERREQREVRLDYYISSGRPGAVPLRCEGFVGRLLRVTENGALTTIQAATPGYRWQRIPVGQNLEFNNTPATRVLMSAFRRIQNEYRGYDFDASLANRKITASGAESMQKYDNLKDIITLVEGDEASRIVRVVDSMSSEVYLYDNSPESLEGAVVWEFEEGRDCNRGEITVETPEEELYEAVEAYRTNEDGTQQTLARVEIDNGDAIVATQDVFPIELTDGSDGAKESAYAICHAEAERRALDMRKLTIPVKYEPFWIAKGSIVSVLRRPLGTDTLERYLMRVDDPDVIRLTSQLSGEARLVSVETSTKPLSNPIYGRRSSRVVHFPGIGIVPIELAELEVA